MSQPLSTEPPPPPMTTMVSSAENTSPSSSTAAQPAMAAGEEMPAIPSPSGSSNGSLLSSDEPDDSEDLPNPSNRIQAEMEDEQSDFSQVTLSSFLILGPADLEDLPDQADASTTGEAQSPGSTLFSAPEWIQHLRERSARITTRRLLGLSSRSASPVAWESVHAEDGEDEEGAQREGRTSRMDVLSRFSEDSQTTTEKGISMESGLQEQQAQELRTEAPQQVQEPPRRLVRVPSTSSSRQYEDRRQLTDAEELPVNPNVIFVGRSGATVQSRLRLRGSRESLTSHSSARHDSRDREGGPPTTKPFKPPPPTPTPTPHPSSLTERMLWIGSAVCRFVRACLPNAKRVETEDLRTTEPAAMEPPELPQAPIPPLPTPWHRIGVLLAAGVAALRPFLKTILVTFATTFAAGLCLHYASPWFRTMQGGENKELAKQPPSSQESPWEPVSSHSVTHDSSVEGDQPWVLEWKRVVRYLRVFQGADT